jgi:hypothetical protein
MRKWRDSQPPGHGEAGAYRPPMNDVHRPSWTLHQLCEDARLIAEVSVLLQTSVPAPMLRLERADGGVFMEAIPDGDLRRRATTEWMATQVICQRARAAAILGVEDSLTQRLVVLGVDHSGTVAGSTAALTRERKYGHLEPAGEWHVLPQAEAKAMLPPVMPMVLRWTSTHLSMD